MKHLWWLEPYLTNFVCFSNVKKKKKGLKQVITAALVWCVLETDRWNVDLCCGIVHKQPFNLEKFSVFWFLAQPLTNFWETKTKQNCFYSSTNANIIPKIFFKKIVIINFKTIFTLDKRWMQLVFFFPPWLIQLYMIICIPTYIDIYFIDGVNSSLPFGHYIFNFHFENIILKFILFFFLIERERDHK